MEKTEQKKRQLIENMADYLLEKGLEQFTLRSLGVAVGISDRMLLHYFVDKNELLTVTLTEISNRLLKKLQLLQPEPLSQPQLIGFLANLIDNPEILPYTNLWLEMTAASVRRSGIYQNVASQIANAFLVWIRTSLKAEEQSEHPNAPELIFTFIEGMVLLNALGQKSTTQLALNGYLHQKVTD